MIRLVLFFNIETNLHIVETHPYSTLLSWKLEQDGQWKNSSHKKKQQILLHSVWPQNEWSSATHVRTIVPLGHPPQSVWRHTGRQTDGIWCWPSSVDAYGDETTARDYHNSLIAPGDVSDLQTRQQRCPWPLRRNEAEARDAHPSAPRVHRQTHLPFTLSPCLSSSVIIIHVITTIRNRART